MKKTNFFKLLLVGTMALSFGFVGCKNYDTEITDICNEIDLLKADVKTIKDQLATLGLIKSITQGANGGDVTIVSVVNGAEQTTTLKVPMPPSGDQNYSTVYVKDGNWWVKTGDSDVDTGYPAEPNFLTNEALMAAMAAAGIDPTKLASLDDVEDALADYYTAEEIDELLGGLGDVVVPTVNEAGNWVFEYDGEGNPIDSGKFAAGAYAVYEEDSDYITVYLWDTVSDPAKMMPFDLPRYSAGAALAKIDLLGWVTGYDGTIRLDEITNIQTADFTEFPFADDRPEEGDVGIHTGVGAADLGAYFPVNYSWIEKFQLDTDAGANDGEDSLEDAPAAMTTWTSFKVGDLVNTLEREERGFIVQVYPSDADLSNVVFTVQDSQGNVLPFDLEAEAFTGQLKTTRGADNSGIYFLKGKNLAEQGDWGTITDGDLIDATGAADADPDAKVAGKYIDAFDPNAAYSIVADDIYHSNYAVEARSRMVKSFEAGVSAVVAADEDNDGVLAGTTWEILPNVIYGLDFDQSTDIETDDDSWFDQHSTPTLQPSVDATPAVTSEVLDYYIEAKGKVNTNEFKLKYYDADGNEITPSATNRARKFSLTFADVITTTGLEMNVYKLGVDGAIYFETIDVLPIRVVPNVPYTLTPFVIEPAEDATNAADNRLMPTKYIDLQEMFDYFETGNNGGKFMWSDNTSLLEYWQDELMGVDDGFVITATKNGVAYDLTVTDGVIDSGLEAEAWTGTLAAPGAAAAASLAEATLLKLTIPFATDDPEEGIFNDATGAYEDEWEFIFTFEDKNNGDVINTLTVAFNPTIPEQNALWTPDLLYWGSYNNGAWVPGTLDAPGYLNAYYPAPAGAWGAAFEATDYDVWPGEDFGFTEIENEATWDWEIVNILEDFDIEDPAEAGTANREVYLTYAQTTDGMLFTLENQFIDGMDEAADGIDWNFNGVEDNDVDSVPFELVKILDPDNAILAAEPYDWDPYKFQINMAPDDDFKYLWFYDVSEADRLAMGYTISIKSPIREGRLETTTGNNIEITPTGSYKQIDNTQITGFTYAGVKFDVFQVWGEDLTEGPDMATGGAVYANRLISAVYFYVPDAYKTWYKIVDQTGVETKTAIAPTQAGEKGYINIDANHSSNAATNVPLGVLVLDRYGRVLQSEDIKFDIAKAL